MPQNSLFTSVTSLAVLLLVGCSSDDPYTGSRGTVTGTITYEGEPVPQGSSVMFFSNKRQAAGIVQANGKYELQALGKKELPTGTYQVEIANPPSGGDAQQTLDPNKPPPTSDSIFPEMYLSKETSGLEFTINAGPNVIDISLVDPPAQKKPE